MAKAETVNPKVEETTPVKVDSPLPKPEAKAENKKQTEQQKKELAFRLFWQATKQLKGATAKEVLASMPIWRDWCGEKRAAELEKSWRLGKAIS